MAWMIQPAIVALGGPPNTRFVGISHPIRLDPRSLEAIETDLRTAHRQGARAVWLAGGEPLMRQDLHKILRSCLDRRLVPAILTNGRMLVYAKIRQLIDRAKVGALRIELHGPRDVHDRLVGVAGAFDQTVEGLRALLIDASRSLHIEVACTVLAENLPSLTQWVDEIATLPRRIPLTFRFVAPLILEDSAQWPRSEQVIEHL
ncbi:MAG TPA: radical SAM protein, partial [Polyangiaceae bacterium]|nr:radical SAM protein [Polyangiaceae bacterium]